MQKKLLDLKEDTTTHVVLKGLKLFSCSSHNHIQNIKTKFEQMLALQYINHKEPHFTLVEFEL